VRLKEYLDRAGRVDLLKMDIEGAEADVLEDCRGSLGGVQHLFVEYHAYTGQPQRLDACWACWAKAASGISSVRRPTGPVLS
jgi:hypothetical protein